MKLLRVDRKIRHKTWNKNKYAIITMVGKEWVEVEHYLNNKKIKTGIINIKDSFSDPSNWMIMEEEKVLKH